jgi:hypothetical protein
MKSSTLRLPTKYGLETLQPMTLVQAKRHGERNFLTRDLRNAGFTVSVFTSDPEIHGSAFFRINIGKVFGKAS